MEKGQKKRVVMKRGKKTSRICKNGDEREVPSSDNLFFDTCIAQAFTE